MRSLALAAPLIAALAACTTLADQAPERVGSATLSLASGMPAGTAQILAHGTEVTITIAVTGIAPGVHGIHLHTVGACSRPDFASAGGHLNPQGRRHGSLAADGKHAGDLPNIVISAGGNGSLSTELSGTPAQVREWLFDGDGTAIVVHADPDDYKTDPTGNSGARIACGVIKPS
jgi:superoxide dismutase, Cu-Zn family